MIQNIISGQKAEFERKLKESYVQRERVRFPNAMVSFRLEHCSNPFFGEELGSILFLNTCQSFD